jgi:hypothetical protein
MNTALEIFYDFFYPANNIRRGKIERTTCFEVHLFDFAQNLHSPIEIVLSRSLGHLKKQIRYPGHCRNDHDALSSLAGLNDTRNFANALGVSYRRAAEFHH